MIGWRIAALSGTGILAAVLLACSADDGAARNGPAGGDAGGSDPRDAGAVDAMDGGLDGGDAGSGNVDPGLSSRSGTRLRRVLVGPTGAADRELVELQDTSLDLRCAPGLEQSGSARCLPRGTIKADVELYSDASCTSGVASYVAANAPQLGGCNTHAITRSGPITTLFPFGATHDPSDGLFEKQGGPCSASSAHVNEAYNALGAGRAIADLAPFKREVVPLTPMLTRSYHAAEDGARYPQGWVLTSAGAVSCTPMQSSDGSLRCLPGGELPIYYQDATCTAPVVLEGGLGAGAPTFVRRRDASACPPKSRLHSLGAAAPVPQVFQLGSDGACKATIYTNWKVQPLLAEIPPSSLPELTADVVDGGRLSAIYYAAGAERAFATFIDNGRGGATCRFRTAADGVYRCLPFDAGNDFRKALTLYSDDKCATAVRFVEQPDACGLDAVSLHDPSSCPTKEVWKTYALGPVTSAKLYEKRSASCLPYTPRSPLRPLGAEIAAAEFAEGAVTVE